MKLCRSDTVYSRLISVNLAIAWSTISFEQWMAWWTSKYCDRKVSFHKQDIIKKGETVSNVDDLLLSEIVISKTISSKNCEFQERLLFYILTKVILLFVRRGLKFKPSSWNPPIWKSKYLLCNIYADLIAAKSCSRWKQIN